MKDLTCLNTIITDNLAAHIDLSSLKSWDLNTALTSNSITKWSGAFSNDIFLYDFGLTGFDNGRVDKMTNSLSINAEENKLRLYRVGYNNPTGGTFYDGYDITGVTGSNVGNYFQLNGGFLQGFFKLNGYDYQTLPYRYGKGITIETIINIEPASFNNGFFLYLGARSEDKYIPEFSGECVTYTATTTTVVYGSKMGYEKTFTEKLYSGVTTSLDNHLNSLTTQEVPKKAINDEKHTEEVRYQNINDDIYNNVIGFYLSSEGKLGYKKINENGILLSNESDSRLTRTGWTIITIQFKPYDIITDPKTLDCAPIRKGDLNVFVNGRLFWKIKEFDEFYFRGFKNDKEKQLGVPFNVSWGGGSFGLKHSYHWDLNKRTIFDENSQIEISTGYSFVNNPNANYDCPPAPISGISQYMVITGNNTNFNIIDPCDPNIVTPNTVLLVANTGGTGTTAYEYYIQHNQDIELISNRDYTFTVNFYDNNIFRLYSSGETGLFFSGNIDIMILEESVYKTNVGLPNEWNEIRYKIRLKENTNIQTIKVGFYLKSDMPLNDDFVCYFDKFSFVGSDKLVKDSVKSNQTIEKYYSNSFIGGIQKLRIYDNSLSPQEVLHNAMIEAKNVGYNLNISKGGRLIYE